MTRHKYNPGLAFEVRRAHEEALKMNEAHDVERRETYKRVFGFVPRKIWSKAQKARAAQSA